MMNECGILKNFSVEFKRGSLLKKEMLSYLEKEIRFLYLKYEDYADGFVSGFCFYEQNNEIYLGKGIFKFEGDLYFLENDINIQEIIKNAADIKDGSVCSIVFRRLYEKKYLHESVFEKNFCIKVLCNSKDVLLPTDFIVGKFEYTKNINRVIFKQDASSEEKINNLCSKSFFNILDFKYSIKGENTFHPIIFEVISHILENKADKCEMDFLLLSMIYTEKVISKKILKLYIERSGEKCTLDDAKELLEKFKVAAKKLSGASLTLKKNETDNIHKSSQIKSNTRRTPLQ